jgi:hypothetical protein
MTIAANTMEKTLVAKAPDPLLGGEDDLGGRLFARRTETDYFSERL